MSDQIVGGLKVDLKFIKGIWKFIGVFWSFSMTVLRVLIESGLFA